VKLALITPPQMQQTANMFELSYHLVLAQHLDDERYFRWYRQKASHGDFIIMDNGAAEFGQSADFDQVVAMAESVLADEIVMPDVLQDAEGTLKLTQTYLNRVVPKYRMMVPQGKALEDWKECLAEMVSWECASIGIPKLYEDLWGRKKMLQHIYNQTLHYSHHIHLLGCYQHPVREITEARTDFPWIRGIDTGAPFAYAQKGAIHNYQSGFHVSLDWHAEIGFKGEAVGNIYDTLEACLGGPYEESTESTM